MADYTKNIGRLIFEARKRERQERERQERAAKYGAGIPDADLAKMHFVIDCEDAELDDMFGLDTEWFDDRYPE